ncbi:hypothetical protein BC567DRAFT_221522 [Phyllosticta citribraziliensis]
MLANTITSAMALFAVAASAAPAPAPAAALALDTSALKKFNWNLTSITSSYTPSGNYRSLDFTVAFSAQTNTTHCASGYGANGNFGGVYQPCDNAAVTFTSNLGISCEFCSSSPGPFRLILFLLMSNACCRFGVRFRENWTLIEMFP